MPRYRKKKNLNHGGHGGHGEFFTEEERRDEFIEVKIFFLCFRVSVIKIAFPFALRELRGERISIF